MVRVADSLIRSTPFANTNFHYFDPRIETTGGGEDNLRIDEACEARLAMASQARVIHAITTARQKPWRVFNFD